MCTSIHTYAYINIKPPKAGDREFTHFFKKLSVVQKLRCVFTFYSLIKRSFCLLLSLLIVFVVNNPSVPIFDKSQINC